MGWLKEFCKLVVIVTGLLAIAWLILRGAGFYVQVEKRLGRETETTMHFGASDPPPPFEQDFVATTPQSAVMLIGDGMGFSHLLAARAALKGMGGRLLLERFPVTGWLTTYSAADAYTDSAAAATALATGAKTHPGAVSVDTEGRDLLTLAEAAIASGKAVGLITDSYLWDATPAAFAAHSPSRRHYATIAADMAELGADLLMGEERGGFLADDDDDDDFLSGFREQGYRIVRDAAALQEAREETAPLLALFPAGTVADAQQAPDLARLVEIALDRLSSAPGGFFLLVETEETDTGSHNSAFSRMVRGVAALDAVAARIVDHVDRDRHTLVLATSDHETGGLALLLGEEGQPLTVRWATGNHTAEPVPLLAYGPGAERLAGVHDNTQVAHILAELLGISLAE